MEHLERLSIAPTERALCGVGFFSDCGVKSLSAGGSRTKGSSVGTSTESPGTADLKTSLVGAGKL